jgi:hypothetical protein
VLIVTIKDMGALAKIVSQLIRYVAGKGALNVPVLLLNVPVLGIVTLFLHIYFPSFGGGHVTHPHSTPLYPVPLFSMQRAT